MAVASVKAIKNLSKVSGSFKPPVFSSRLGPLHETKVNTNATKAISQKATITNSASIGNLGVVQTLHLKEHSSRLVAQTTSLTPKTSISTTKILKSQEGSPQASSENSSPTESTNSSSSSPLDAATTQNDTNNNSPIFGTPTGTNSSSIESSVPTSGFASGTPPLFSASAAMRAQPIQPELPSTLNVPLFTKRIRREKPKPPKKLTRAEKTKLRHDKKMSFKTFPPKDSPYRLHPELTDAEQRQLDLEVKAIQNARDRYELMMKQVTEIGRAASLGPSEEILLRWYESLLNEISLTKELVKSGYTSMEATGMYGYQFNFLSAQKFAVITMHTVLGMMLQTGVPVNFTKMVLEVADACRAEYNLERLKAIKHKYKVELNVRKINKRADFYLDDSDWSNKEKGFLGGILVDRLIKTARIGDKNELAFEHEFVTGPDGRQIGVIKAHPEVYKLVEQGHKIRDTTHARYFPMLVPPKDWTSPKEGGYLACNNPIIRYKGFKKHFVELIKEDKEDSTKLDQVYRCLNGLSRTPWTINNELYEVINRVWEEGGGLADLPARTDIPVPPKPNMASPDEYTQWKRKMRKIEQQNRDLHSLRCDTIYKLQVAKEFLGETFYFPHSMDFRGRTYPIPPHLNHLGSDFSRSLLKFAEKKPLGTRGISWLKIHLANLWGNDKISFEERERFVDQNISAVMDSADKPLDGDRWWLKADSPWQCLAACKELTQALRSGSPETFLSNLPIHQDGTCNGLQHYSALGGDILGAKHVNLLPSDRPGDVYRGVADAVNRRLEEDAKAGNPLAKQMAGKVDRKIVKQTVMTSVYGVTFVGASKQIAGQLKDKKLVPEEEIFQAAVYLSRLTFASLGEIFEGARAIMDWLATCARKIALEANAEVAWDSPMGLLIIQPYKKENGTSEVIKTVVQKICVVNPDELRVNVNRQKSAFPPNYVHSIDSSHMMMTAIRMQELGLTYAAVHDSYWTHACYVDQMNTVLRDQFIELHSRPLLQELLDNFNRRYPYVWFPPLPKKGPLDLAQVANSRYFFN